MSAIVRIAMWSGPRNLSTALMRSFGARPDTHCVDEPFYAAYLKLTGLDHPMRAEILAAHDADPAAVARHLGVWTSPKPIFFQKHMTHHMIAAMPRDWMARVHNAFLIRHPARVLASYARKMESVDLDAVGFPQQLALFEHAMALSGAAPAVIDADDLLGDPPRLLAALCAKLGIAYDAAMLSWSPGAKPEDGAWAPHWYDAIRASTGFVAPTLEPPPALPENLARLCEVAMPMYERLAAFKLR